MIQGGAFTADGQHKETDSIKGEFDGNGVTNPLKHTKGVLSMARTMFPNSASSQFFIMHEDAPHLDGQYAAFGKVTDGIEVVDEIAATPTTEGIPRTSMQYRPWHFQQKSKKEVHRASVHAKRDLCHEAAV